MPTRPTATFERIIVHEMFNILGFHSDLMGISLDNECIIMTIICNLRHLAGIAANDIVLNVVRFIVVYLQMTSIDS